jgi:hypothetical protein
MTKQAEFNAGALIMEHEVNTKRIVKALIGGDEVGALVRCHFEAEQAINHVLNQLSGGRTKREVERWQQIANKLEICRVLGVGDNFCAPLKTLNKHRNDFAHNGRDTLDEQEVLDLFRQVRIAYPQFDDSFHISVGGEQQFDKIYKNCSNKEKYVICCALAITMFSNMPQIMAKAARTPKTGGKT